MIVRLIVGESDAAEVDVGGHAPYIYGLMKAIKLEMPNTFLTTDANKIVIKDPSTNLKIASTETLTLTSPNGNQRGNVTIPFIVEDPQ